MSLGKATGISKEHSHSLIYLLGRSRNFGPALATSGRAVCSGRGTTVE